MSDIEVFVQGEDLPEITLVHVPSHGKVRDLVEAARAHGARLVGEGETPIVLIEDLDEALGLDAPLQSAGIGQRSRVHIHRCQQVALTVNYGARSIDERFPASTTVAKVKRWATGKHGFNLSEVDAAEHALQLVGSAVRPDEDTHIGSLTQFPACAVGFDLVPKQRVEG